MKSILITLLIVFFVSAQNFSDFFEDKTLRVDYFHSGIKGQEFFAMDEIYEYDAWAGSKKNLVSSLNLGEYQVRVFDGQTAQLIYSRGYSTIFNEWQTTAEAQNNYHTFHESILIPKPKNRVQFAIYRRDKNMFFRELFSTVIDPGKEVQIHSAPNKPNYKVTKIMQNGSASEMVDIVILGDGYSKNDIDKLRKDAQHFNDAMFDSEPFKSRKKDFNVWLVEVISEDSGIPMPDKNVWKNNALGCQYNTFGSARYILSENNKAIRDAAGLVPYDYINILVNDNRYGGGGIYNLYTTTYTQADDLDQAWQMDYVYVHEFGHSFAGLGDEYYSSQISYEEFYKKDVEPWERNVTALLDTANLKWQEFAKPETPLPTPWNKHEYDSLAVERGKLDRLAPDYYEKREPYIARQKEILKTDKYAGVVGAFEGSGYEAQGLYRPSIDCRMFSLSLTPFDPVCAAALEEVIDYLTR